MYFSPPTKNICENMHRLPDELQSILATMPMFSQYSPLHVSRGRRKRKPVGQGKRSFSLRRFSQMA